MVPTDTVRVQVLHGDALIAAGLAATLREEPDIVLVTPAEPADLLITDYDNGLAMLARARHDPRLRAGRLPVLIVTARDTEVEIRHALEQGARGYLLVDCRIDELMAGVRALRAGTRHVAGKAAQRLADSVAGEALTGREQAVLRLVVDGLCNKAVANRLQIAVGTVKSHLKSIFQKLDAASRTEVAAIAERRGLLAGVPPVQFGGLPAPAQGRSAPRSPFTAH